MTGTAAAGDAEGDGLQKTRDAVTSKSVQVRGVGGFEFGSRAVAGNAAQTIRNNKHNFAAVILCQSRNEIRQVHLLQLLF